MNPARSLRIVQTLDRNEFVSLSRLFLADKGIHVHLGPPLGPDMGVDGYGAGPAGTFVVHATSQRRQLKAKLLGDLKNGIESFQKGQHDPAREIYFFTQERPFQSEADRDRWVAGPLLSAALNGEPRYRTEPPTIQIWSGDQIAEIITSDASFRLSRGYISQVHRESLQEYDFDLQLDSKAGPNLLDLLELYIIQPPAAKYGTASRILESAWEQLRGDLLVAHRLRLFLANESGDSKQSRDATLFDLVLGIVDCAAAATLQEPLGEEEISELWRMRFSDCELLRDDAVRNAYDLLLARIVRHLLYARLGRQPSDLLSLLGDHERGGEFWARFRVDCWLRIRTRVVFVTIELEESLEIAAATYAVEHPGAPLSRIIGLMRLFPSALVRRTRRVFVEEFGDLARRSTNPLELRWVMMACYYLLPLSDADEEEVVPGEDFVLVAQQAQGDLLRRVPIVLSLQLHMLLFAYLRTRRTTYITQFEQELYHNLPYLPQEQLAVLRIEYASCVYQMLNVASPSVEGTIFGRLLGDRAALLESFLFESSDIQYRAKPTGWSRIDVSRWIVGYLNRLFSAFVRRRLVQSPLYATRLSCLAQVWHLDEVFTDALSRALAQYEQEAEDISPDYYARAIRLLVELRPSTIEDVGLRYLEAAQGASRYAIIRNARAIWEVLFRLYFYSGHLDGETTRRLGEYFATATEVGEGEPRFHWLLAGAIFAADGGREREFLGELIEQLCVVGVVEQSLMRQDFSFQVDEALIAYIRENAESGSLGLRECIQNAEAWNLLGTTIRNIYGAEMLESAAKAYAVARCLAFSQGKLESKYSYNLLRSASEGLAQNRRLPSDFFVEDAARWLSTARAANFYFRRQGAGPFAELVARNWGVWSADTQEVVVNAVQKRKWLRDIFGNAFAAAGVAAPFDGEKSV